ncbi:LOW QUALITY PROTEIN: hypothetical protein V2J09_013209 [Rumex salicifolius]
MADGGAEGRASATLEVILVLEREFEAAADNEAECRAPATLEVILVLEREFEAAVTGDDIEYLWLFFSDDERPTTSSATVVTVEQIFEAADNMEVDQCRFAVTELGAVLEGGDAEVDCRPRARRRKNRMWIWQYFMYILGNPKPFLGTVDDQRRARRYHINQTRLQTRTNALHYRGILDELVGCHKELPFLSINIERRGTVGLYSSWFGRRQSPPLHVIKPHTALWPVTLAGKLQYSLQFDPMWRRWAQMEDHICPYILDSSLACPTWDISHPYINPEGLVQPPIEPCPPPLDAHRRRGLAHSYAQMVLDTSVAGDWTFLPRLPSIWERGESSRMAEERAREEELKSRPSASDQ